MQAVELKTRLVLSSKGCRIKPPIDDVGNDTSCRLLDLGENFSGTITRGDTDCSAVDLQQGETYAAIVSGASTGGGTLADPYLEVRNGSGQLLYLITTAAG